MRGAALALVTVLLVLPCLWAGAALGIDGPASLAPALVAGFALACLAALVFVRPYGRALLALFLLFAAVAFWWMRIPPSNDRDWQPDVARLPRAQLDGNILTVENVRDFVYRSETDYDARWVTRKYDLAKLEHLDMYFSFWGPTDIAHTIMSWSFAEGPALAISIETRKEVGESYSALLGFFRQYELYYVVARERDVIGVRDIYRGERTYLYRLSVPPDVARRLLMSYVTEINDLVDHPQWYNALTDNCTTSIRTRVLAAGGGLPFSWRLVLNGHLPELLYERGSLDRSMPLDELTRKSDITERAKAAGMAENFSQQIRAGLPRMDLPAGTP
jgi:Domain of unknown function (DUF4105)